MNIKTCEHGVRPKKDCRACALAYGRRRFNRPEKKKARAEWYLERKLAREGAKREWYLRNRESVRLAGIKRRTERPDEMLLARHRAYARATGNTLLRWPRTCSPSVIRAHAIHCAICKRLLGQGHARQLDHCHNTGWIRDTLCHACNKLLGDARDSPTILHAAIDYLERWAAQHARWTEQLDKIERQK